MIDFKTAVFVWVSGGVFDPSEATRRYFEERDHPIMVRVT